MRQSIDLLRPLAERTGVHFRPISRKRIRLRTENKRGKPAIGRKIRFAPGGQFAGGESRVVALRGGGDGGGVRLERLNVDFTGFLRSAGAAAHLRQQLIGTFACAGIGTVQGRVGIEHADERHVREVEALGYHLGAEKHIRLAGAEVGENVVVRKLPRGRIRIHPQDPRPRETHLQRGLRPLRTHAAMGQLLCVAHGALRRKTRPAAAHMAAQAVIRPMVGKRHRAVRTLRHPATFRTVQHAGVAAPVEKEDCLLAAVKPAFDGFEEQGRVYRHVARTFQLVLHVHEMDIRKRASRHARGHGSEDILALFRVEPRFERWRSAAKHHARAFEPRPHDGDVARMVTRRFVLLVRRIVLLVYNDEAEIRNRREHRAARSHDHTRLARADAMPFVVALAVGKRGMQHGNLTAKASRETADCLRRERNLRHEHDRSLSLREQTPDGLEIYLGLSAACDAVQQDGTG